MGLMRSERGPSLFFNRKELEIYLQMKNSLMEPTLVIESAF